MTAMPLALADVPIIDPYSAEFNADPHAVFRTARAVSSVVQNDLGVGFLSYAANEALLLDPKLTPGVFKLLDFMGLTDRLMTGPGRTLLGTEGDEHTAIRR